MQSFPTQSHSNIQTYYQNASLTNFYVNSSFIVLIIGVFLILRTVINKERRAQKIQRQIEQLEKIYLLEYKNRNIK